MTRERLARAALRAYPAAARASRGEEMLGTLLDSSSGSRRRFGRELLNLVRLGLRARATETAGAGAGRLVADGFCIAGVWLMALGLGSDLARKLNDYPDDFKSPWAVGLLAGALVLALVGYDRLAGVVALVATAAEIPGLEQPYFTVTFGLWPLFLPAVCFAVMALAPRRRQRDLRRLGWLAVPVALAWTNGGDGDLSALAAVAVLAFLFLPALARIAVDPRNAIACALLATDVGIVIAAHSPADPEAPPALLFLAAAPVVVAAAVARTRRLQRRTVV